MNVAVVTYPLDRRSRSSNLVRMLGAFDRAAGGDPAPDMVILPGGCDGCGLVGEKSLPVGSVYAFRTAMAGKAREWGVYAAGGYHGGLGGVSSATSVLLDANGDCLLEAPGARRIVEESAGGTVVREVGAFRKTVFGVVGLYDVREPENLAGAEVDLVIACLSEAADGGAAKMAADLAGRFGGTCAVCWPGAGAVVDGGGRVVATVDERDSVAVFTV